MPKSKDSCVMYNDNLMIKMIADEKMINNLYDEINKIFN